MSDTPETPAIRLDPAERWDYLLTLENPTDEECWRALTTEAGFTALQKFPNIIERATKVYRHLPALLLTSYEPEWKATAVRDKADLSAPVDVADAEGLFG